jgi:hypothetical protein
VLALCAEALGAMEVAKEATLDYLRTRKQFGVPIGSFQALQHRMADLLLEVEQARSAVINAAAASDADRITRERALSAAKFSIGRIGTLVAEESIQLHGGIGMTWELPLSHYAKRLVMIDHQLGDEDHHLQRYIALGREAGMSEVLCEQRGAVRVLINHDPATRNALNADLYAALAAALDEAQADPQVGAIVLAGAATSSAPAATCACWPSGAAWPLSNGVQNWKACTT